MTEINRARQIANLGADVVSVKDFGADPTGAVNSAGAIQDAIDSLEPLGGEIFIPPGRYKITTGITINNTNFPNGGVTIRGTHRSIFDVTGSGVVGFTFSGASGASVLDRCGIDGCQIVGVQDSATGGVLLQNVTRFSFSNQTLISGFDTSSGGGTRYGVKQEYGMLTDFDSAYINNCDYGIEIGQATGVDFYRSTTVSIRRTNITRCRIGVFAKDIFTMDMDNETTLENNSIGVYLYGDETSGTNCAGINITGHFESNGTHILAEENGTGVHKGINISHALFETLRSTYYPVGVLPPVNMDSTIHTPNEDKVSIEGMNCCIENNVWSSAAAVNDIEIVSGTDNRIDSQGSDISALTITDTATDTQHLYALEMGQVSFTSDDATPDVTGISLALSVTTGALNVTGFDGGYIGQIVRIRHTNANATYINSATLVLYNAADKTTVTGEMLQFIKITDTKWMIVS